MLEDISIRTDSLLSENLRRYWGEVEQRVKKDYNIPSLLDYLESRISKCSVVNLADELNVNRRQLYRLLQKMKLVPKRKYIKHKARRITPDVKRTQLVDLEDIIDLDVSNLNSLSSNQINYWKPVEDKIIEEHKAPSLSAYIIYQYHFNKRSLKNLAPELGRSYQALWNLMRNLGIPIRSASQSLRVTVYPIKGKTFEERYGAKRAKLMKENISKRQKERAKSIRGKTFKEIYGPKRAKQIKLKESMNMTGEKNPNFGKHLSEEWKQKISDSKSGKNHPFFGKHLPKKWRDNISKAKRGLNFS